MARLIFFVARSGVIDIRQAVERELSVADKSRPSGSPIDFFIRFVAFVCAHGIDEAAAARDLLKCSVDEALELSVRKALVEVAHFPQFLFDVALFNFSLKGAEC